MLTLTADLDVFARERGSVQKEREEALYRSALYALRNHGKKDWFKALVERATRVMREQYHEDTGKWTSKEMRKAQDAFRKSAASALRKTKKPTPERIKQSARSIAASLSTNAINAALEAAGVDDERTGLEKVWLSMEDARVRPTHDAANRQAVPIGEKFTVGGSRMDRPGDMSAPIDEWINCRCIVAIVEGSTPDAMAAAASQVVTLANDPAEHAAVRSIGVFALPAESDPVNAASSEDVAHMTVIWLGTDEQRADAGIDLPLDDVKQDVKSVADSLAVIIAKVTERGVLGDDEADVLFIDADDVRSIREGLLEHETILDAMKAVEQFPEWTPHVTLGYPDAPGVVQYDEETVTFDRLALWVGDSHYEYPLGGDMPENDDTQDVPEAPAPEDRLDYSDDPIPFWGVVAPEGAESGDGRMFSNEALRARPLPLPLAYQKTNEPGHDGSFKVANIEKAWRRDGKVFGSGHFLTTVPEVDEVIGVMAESGGRMGVSVDADDGEMQMMMRDGRTLDEALDEMAEDGEGIDINDLLTVFSSARVCGATLCNIPAFHQAFMALGEVPEEYAPNEDEYLVVESRTEGKERAAAAAKGAEALAAAGAKTEDGPGWLTHPVDTDRLRDYWVSGKGATEIGWGMPGDFNRCRTNLSPYVKPQYLSGYCANRHYDALGYWPGQHHALDALAAAAEAAQEVGKDMTDESLTVGRGLTLVASAASDEWAPPAEWFSDPGLVEPSRLVVTEDGRVYGHLAAWGVCHIGIEGQCVTAPPSPSNYAYYRTGTVTCADGSQVAVGTLTMETGHANLRASAKKAVAHYDNTGTAVAHIASGEDEFGIWIAGAVAPGVTEEQVIKMRAAGAISGDWRNIGGEMELVAGLVVNVPGFPIPHVALAASGTNQNALVAAGVVAKDAKVGEADAPTVAEIVEQTLTAFRENEKANQRLEAVRMSVQAARMAEAKERLARVAAGRK